MRQREWGGEQKPSSCTRAMVLPKLPERAQSNGLERRAVIQPVQFGAFAR